jgi:hypothetical protein
MDPSGARRRDLLAYLNAHQLDKSKSICQKIASSRDLIAKSEVHSVRPGRAPRGPRRPGPWGNVCLRLQVRVGRPTVPGRFAVRLPAGQNAPPVTFELGLSSPTCGQGIQCAVMSDESGAPMLLLAKCCQGSRDLRLYIRIVTWYSHCSQVAAGNWIVSRARFLRNRSWALRRRDHAIANHCRGVCGVRIRGLFGPDVIGEFDVDPRLIARNSFDGAGGPGPAVGCGGPRNDCADDSRRRLAQCPSCPRASARSTVMKLALAYMRVL